ncbi:MAG: patatin-like phospholipase family protein [Bacteroidales bacterium]|nr:patatin-like phospholipase family protein [Bacteroidales bacterium]
MNKKKIGLALSGGGYRAAAYHIGTLRALNRLGILDKVDVISAVSGGSITAAYYALHKDNYEKFESSFIKKLQRGVLCSTIVYLLLLLSISLLVASLVNWWLLIPEVIILLICWYWILPVSCFIECSYNRLFFKNKKLSDLPQKPLVAINATDVSNGKLYTFSQLKMGGYPYYKNGDNTSSPFDNTQFTIAKAVMASSCVPFAFSPIKISKKFCKEDTKTPILIDGGLYDNQGTHKLSTPKSLYHTDYIIVSDAGNTQINSKWILNPICLLIKTSDIMMDRIKRFQRHQNIYTRANPNRYAYVPLEWNIEERLIRGFVRNIIDGNIVESLYYWHKISSDDINNLTNSDKEVSNNAFENIVTTLKKSIGWENLHKRNPDKDSCEIARSVGTNLIKLKRKKIDALIRHAEALTEIQVRLYLPEIIEPHYE